jgi:hypothetical protein
MQLIALDGSRPPGSIAETTIGTIVARRMRRVGLRPIREAVRAPTSPTWAPLLRALLRVWSAAFLAAGWPLVGSGLAAIAVLGGIPAAGRLVRFVPLLGGRSTNVVASRRGTDHGSRPLVVVAHMDTHPTQGAPLRRTHSLAAAVSGWLALLAGVAAASATGWRPAAAIVAAESVFTLAWLARQELETVTDTPDDNTSGLVALVRVAELIVDGPPVRDVWLVATTAGTTASCGARTFLKTHRDLRRAWVVEIDALGAGEVVASPHASRFPFPGTPVALTRAITAAAQQLGDPLSVRKVGRSHSDANAALRLRMGAIALTGGLHPPRGGIGPDPANAERAARIVDTLARSQDVAAPEEPTRS